MGIDLTAGTLQKPKIPNNFDWTNQNISHIFDFVSTDLFEFDCSNPIRYIEKYKAQTHFFWQKESHISIDLRATRQKYGWLQKRPYPNFDIKAKFDLVNYGIDWYYEFFDKKGNIVFPELKDFITRTSWVGVANIVNDAYGYRDRFSDLKLGFHLEKEKAQKLKQKIEFSENIAYYNRLILFLENFEQGRDVIKIM